MKDLKIIIGSGAFLFYKDNLNLYAYMVEKINLDAEIGNKEKLILIDKMEDSFIYDFAKDIKRLHSKNNIDLFILYKNIKSDLIKYGSFNEMLKRLKKSLEV